MPFHRLTVPSYSGGLPGGYDYINNQISGTPAAADGAKSGGPNSGTYFVAFGEDATSSNFNRSAKALAQNCDYLDDLLRRDLAIRTIRGDELVAGSPKTTVTLTGPGVFLGAPGTPNTTAGLATIFQILDDNDREIVDPGTGTECTVTAISDTVGTNFSAGNVDLTVTPGIPIGVTFRVVYGIRSSLATMPVDTLTNVIIRGAQEVPGELIAPGGASLVGFGGSGNWADGTTNPAATVEAQLDKIVTDLATGAGTAKVRGNATTAAWKDGTVIPAGTLASQVEHIVSVLRDDGALAPFIAGTERIASKAYFSPPAQFQLSAGSLHSALVYLTNAINRFYKRRTGVTGAFTVNSGQEDSFVFFSRTGADYSITLPSPGTSDGRPYFFFETAGTLAPGGNTVTLARSGSEKINNLAADYLFNVPYGRWMVVSDGTDWHVFKG